jgi:hypothetical protein
MFASLGLLCVNWNTNIIWCGVASTKTGQNTLWWCLCWPRGHRILGPQREHSRVQRTTTIGPDMCHMHFTQASATFIEFTGSNFWR